MLGPELWKYRDCPGMVAKALEKWPEGQRPWSNSCWAPGLNEAPILPKNLGAVKPQGLNNPSDSGATELVHRVCSPRKLPYSSGVPEAWMLSFVPEHHRQEGCPTRQRGQGITTMGITGTVAIGSAVTGSCVTLTPPPPVMQAACFLGKNGTHWRTQHTHTHTHTE